MALNLFQRDTNFKLYVCKFSLGYHAELFEKSTDGRDIMMYTSQERFSSTETCARLLFNLRLVALPLSVPA